MSPSRTIYCFVLRKEVLAITTTGLLWNVTAFSSVKRSWHRTLFFFFCCSSFLSCFALILCIVLLIHFIPSILRLRVPSLIHISFLPFFLHILLHQFLFHSFMLYSPPFPALTYFALMQKFNSLISLLPSCVSHFRPFSPPHLLKLLLFFSFSLRLFIFPSTFFPSFFFTVLVSSCLHSPFVFLLYLLRPLFLFSLLVFSLFSF